MYGVAHQAVSAELPVSRYRDVRESQSDQSHQSPLWNSTITPTSHPPGLNVGASTVRPRERTVRACDRLRLNVVSVGIFEDGLLDHHHVLSRQDYTAGQTRTHTGGSGTNNLVSKHI